MGAIRATKPRTAESVNITQSYTTVSQSVKRDGLLGRTRWFYLGLTTVLLAALVGAGFGFVLLGSSWFQLLIAGALGLILTQFAFIAH